MFFGAPKWSIHLAGLIDEEKNLHWEIRKVGGVINKVEGL